VLRSRLTLAICLCANLLGFWTVVLEPDAIQRLFVLILWTSATLTMACVTLRPLTSATAGALLLGGVKALALLKERYWGAALVPTDFLYFAGHNLSVLQLYPEFLWASGAAAAASGVALLAALGSDRRYVAADRLRGLTVLRGVLGGLALLVWTGTFSLQGPFQRLKNKNVWARLTDEAQLTNFLINLRLMRVTLPRMDASNI
jgi:hypothetical protein